MPTGRRSTHGSKQFPLLTLPAWRSSGSLMLNNIDYEAWCISINLPAYARAVIDCVRESQPSRRVRSGHENVSGRYPSRKMGHTIQFESHRNELATIMGYEHDEDVLEFWDQP